ncbi:MAG: glycosyltransferase family 2 protein [Lachnospiraceae bacterium]|nr:glycosyltransferase family 2 protein [Lachnospiraceae bacterium]
MEGLISIVLPIYNGEKYMRESIDSVINQTYQNWELLILDDCSSDNTSNIAQEYVKRDKRISYYRNEKNLRLPRNLNKGFSLAHGDYLTWTSDDNRYKPTALEKMYDALQKDLKAQFVFASCRIIDGNGKAIEYIMVNEWSKKRIVGENPVGACFMYTREVYEKIGNYDPDLTLVEDYDYWQRIFGHFETVALEEILYEYRWHDGALTSTMKQETFNKTLEKVLLKNRSLFGKIDFGSQYYYYKGLYTCEKNLGNTPNIYSKKYQLFSLIYLLQYRVPNKLKRMLRR